MNFKLRQRPQGSEISILIDGRARFRRPRTNLGGKILDALDLVARKQDFAKLADVQPLVRRALNAAEVKIEAVHVNEGFHADLSGNAEADPFEPASRSATEATEEMI